MSPIRPFAALPLLLAAVSPALGEAPPPVSEARLRADVERMVAFGTRHTLSSQTDPKRGIGAAWAWAEAEFRKTSKACGNCLAIARPEKVVSGNRIPEPVRLIDVIAIQRGTERPNEVVIVQGHIDSRRSNEMDATGDAPGANDDGSGTALVLEAARVLSGQTFPSTIVYAVLTGEEQGLYGGRLLADYARAQGWTVKAVLNNDIVGNSRGSDGYVDDRHVRVFSEGPRADLDERTRKAQRAYGGENDSPSRNLSRYVAALAEKRADGFAVRQVWRADRAGRGGDHLPFEELGYPAIRFTVAVENFHRQHQDVRTENGVSYGDLPDAMDFPYLARVTALNVAALTALARAPMPPVAKADFAVKTSTDISWTPVAGATAYAVWRRRTDAGTWEPAPIVVDGQASGTHLEGVRGDDWVFGVSARAADGSESAIASALPGGQFAPLAP